MPQGTMQRFVGQDTFEFRWAKRLDIFLAVVNGPSVRLHRLDCIGNEAQAQAQRSEERVREQELHAGFDQLRKNWIFALHDTTVCGSGGKPMYAAIRRVISAALLAVWFDSAADLRSSFRSTTSSLRISSAIFSSELSPSRFSFGRTSSTFTMLLIIDSYSFGLLSLPAALNSAMHSAMWDTGSYRRCQISLVPRRSAAFTDSVIWRRMRSRSWSPTSARKSLTSGMGRTLVSNEKRSVSSCGYWNTSFPPESRI